MLGLLLRVALTRARPQPSIVLGLTAATATVLYDLLAQLSGNRLADPGTPDQVLGIVCVLLFGVAAQHRSMTVLFQPGAFVRRPASAAIQSAGRYSRPSSRQSSAQSCK